MGHAQWACTQILTDKGTQECGSIMVGKSTDEWQHVQTKMNKGGRHRDGTMTVIWLQAHRWLNHLHINTNTINGRMRVESRVTCPSKSTPTDCRYIMMMKGNEEWWQFDKRRWGTMSYGIILRLNDVTMIGWLQAQWGLELLWARGKLSCILWSQNLQYIQNCNRDNDKWGFGTIKHGMLEYVLVRKDKTWKMPKSKDMWEWRTPVSWLHWWECDQYVVTSDLRGTQVESLV